MNENLIGIIENIIYRNEENGYSVIEMSGDDGLMFVAVGILPLIDEGEKVELYGSWTEHKTYGKQFKVQKHSVMRPTTMSEIETYLANGNISGIRRSVARQIVEKFGESTFDVFDNTPERLLEIPGIGKIKLQTILESYNRQRAGRYVMVQLQKYGISISQAIKIYKKYGDDCVNVVESNPYRLIDDIENIGFKTADKIARNVGVTFDSVFRVKAGIKFVLEWAKQEGHTYLPYNVLISATVKTIAVGESLVNEALDDLIETKSLLMNCVDGIDVVFLPYMRKLEMKIAVGLSELARSNRAGLQFDIEEHINMTAKNNGVELAQKQVSALKAMFTQGVVVITGGPGTGKTTILKIAIDMMKSLGMSYELAAPTGRAAKRMTAATGQPAQTIHRLLEFSFVDQCFMKDETDPLDADFIIIDEMSMVDVQLMSAVISAVTETSRIILVGDADQLPSVGAGNVLRDILESGKIYSVRLTEVYRQAEASMIVSNAHLINNGINPVLDDDESDFNFCEIDDTAAILNRLLELCKENSGKRLRTDDVFNDVQLLAPMKKGILGVANLNIRLQETFNPPCKGKCELQIGESVFREGDKVMQIKNDYSAEWTKSVNGVILEEGKGIFNGDIGVIESIDARNKLVTVRFEDGAVVEYTHEMIFEIEHAYCISIHKSQGSEFKIVLMALAGGPPAFLTRNLLYTAVTRAKSQVYIVGRKNGIMGMVSNKSTKSRYTALKSMIEEYNETFNQL